MRHRPCLLGLLAAWAAGCATPVASPPPKPLPPAATTALPGRCVDPGVDAHDRLGPDADGELRVEHGLDLDGDGSGDPLVTQASFCGTGGCTWHLYVRRGACAHHVGAVFGMLPLARPASSGGLVEIEIATRDGCGGMARTESRLRFDGTAYVPYSSRKCRCPEGDEPSEDPERWCDAWGPADAPH